MNKYHGMGNLVRDPESRQVGDKMVVKFTVAIDTSFRDKKSTLFLDCEAWGPRAETILQYFTKGKPIIVHGELRQDNWEDNEGKRREKKYLLVNDFDFIPRVRAEDAPATREGDQPRRRPAAGAQAYPDADGDDSASDDDIPF
jgi:single-strand DNA-binding protein